MRKWFYGFRMLLVPLFLGLVILPAGAQGFFSKISWFAGGSILFFPEDNGRHSGPMPVLPSPGLGFSYPITDVLKFELSYDFYTTHYGYALGRAVPVEVEHRTARVIGSLLGFHVARHFEVTPFMTVRAYGGPAVDLRIVFMAEDLTDGLDNISEVRKDVDSIRRYFWTKGRWLMPVIGGGVDFPLSAHFKIGLDLRIWIPMYRIWSGENLPGIEGWRFGLGIRFTIL